jgi:hypothetical protein
MKTLIALLAVLATGSIAPARADDAIGSVAFILDCSRSMTEPACEDPIAVKQVSTTETSTRMQAADALLRSMLRELAAEPDSQVAVWLYGHRIVWEADVKHPDLLPQDAYLEATVGFGALNGLLPGDDVELVQPFKRFTLQENQQLKVRLDVVKPWGEKPLYLALTRALDALVDQPANAPKTIVVLTDGGNEQWLARHKTNHARVAAALREQLVPIHFIHFGPLPEDNDPAEQELIDLAEQGGGSLKHATATSEITVAQVITSSRQIAAAEEPAEDGLEAKTVPARPVERTISGSVVYYGKPVSSATITLEGSDIPPVKADRQGRFLIRQVPAGRKYRVLVQAVARNHAREKSLDLNVDADSQQQPFLTIDVK